LLCFPAFSDSLGSLTDELSSKISRNFEIEVSKNILGSSVKLAKLENSAVQTWKELQPTSAVWIPKIWIVQNLTEHEWMDRLWIVFCLDKTTTCMPLSQILLVWSYLGTSETTEHGFGSSQIHDQIIFYLPVYSPCFTNIRFFLPLHSRFQTITAKSS
jgi:hypothetical protein